MIRGEWWTKDQIDAELEALQREYAEDEAVIREMGQQPVGHGVHRYSLLLANMGVAWLTVISTSSVPHESSPV